MPQKTLEFIPQPRWWHRPVSYLLWLANSDAPDWRANRLPFYALKSRLLEKHAEPDSCDWQRIIHECWSCFGTGLYTHYSGNQDTCHKCRGSGEYRRSYIRLYRWKFGGRVFHVPGQRQGFRPDYVDINDVIPGRIHHQRQGWRAVLAYWILLALFDRKQLRWTCRRSTKNVFVWIHRKVAMQLPTRCCECGRWMIRKHASAVLTGHRGTIGVLCAGCNKGVPF